MPSRRTVASQPQLWPVTWSWTPGPQASKEIDLIAACAEFYSQEYGKWGPRGRHPGDWIRMSPTQIHRLLEHGDSWLACAYVDGTLAGYCIAIRLHTPLGLVAWITQLVVRAVYRQGRVATQMLYSIWQFTDCYAWGLATANPYAVRTLETATRRPCRQQLIRDQGSDLLQYLSAAVDYLPEELATDAKGHPQPRVNTEFFVSHADLPEMRRLASRGERPWDLGDISEGEEWFALHVLLATTDHDHRRTPYRTPGRFGSHLDPRLRGHDT